MNIATMKFIIFRRGVESSRRTPRPHVAIGASSQVSDSVGYLISTTLRVIVSSRPGPVTLSFA